ncbi:MAG: radical SAM protein [Chloroflexi bacterium]|nr:radical SAM protein [Chloroflexota bacterium]
MADSFLELLEVLTDSSAILDRCWQVRQSNHEPVIRFDRPTDTLPVSLTAGACALRCAHCNGVYLQHMHTLDETADASAPSVLISGGCDSSGRVPVNPAQLARIAQLKKRGQRLNWHVGFLDESEIRQIASLVDLVSFDIVGDQETAREVYGLNVTFADYLRTFDMLRAYVPTVAHITVGLRAGKLSGELIALDALAQRQVQDVVLLVLIPTPGTAYADCPPPALVDVLEVFSAARLRLPQARLYLGCMRPHGDYRQACDELAIRSGFNVVVNPLRPSILLAEQLGLEVRYGAECCALN